MLIKNYLYSWNDCNSTTKSSFSISKVFELCIQYNNIGYLLNQEIKMTKEIIICNIKSSKLPHFQIN